MVSAMWEFLLQPLDIHRPPLTFLSPAILKPTHISVIYVLMFSGLLPQLFQPACGLDCLWSIALLGASRPKTADRNNKRSFVQGSVCSTGRKRNSMQHDVPMSAHLLTPGARKHKEEKQAERGPALHAW